MSHEPRSSDDALPRARIDPFVCAALFVASVAYLLNRPHNLQGADESYYLTIAKRVFEGEVLYRDVFDFLPPLFHWSFAAVFYLFGVTIEAARGAMAVCHGLLCMLIYLACRGIGVGVAFAVCAVLAHLALAQSIWPYVSPHWISTILMTLLFYLLFARNWLRQDRKAFPLGLVVGVLGCVQHHKGVVIAAGVAMVLVLARALDGEVAGAERWRSIRSTFALLVAGALCVAIPCLSVAIAQAGIGPVIEALFVTTLRDYASYHHAPPSWAHVDLMTRPLAAYSRVAVLRWSPLVLVAAVAQSVSLRWSKGARADWLPTIWQVAFALFWMAAIAYFPDFIHVAFVSPVFFIIGAAVLQKALPAYVRWGRIARFAVAGVLALALGIQLYGNAQLFRRRFPLSRDTAFGTVAFADPRDLWLLDRVGRELTETGDRQLFFYPVCSLYLTLDARNPTRHQFLLAAFNPPEHFREVTEALEAKDPPILVLARVPSDRPEYRQLMDFVARRYVPTESKIRGLDLYVRRPGR